MLPQLCLCQDKRWLLPPLGFDCKQQSQTDFAPACSCQARITYPLHRNYATLRSDEYANEEKGKMGRGRTPNVHKIKQL